MRHDWIIDVLEDLLTYAQLNGFPALGREVEEVLRVARQEIAVALSEVEALPPRAVLPDPH